MLHQVSFVTCLAVSLHVAFASGELLARPTTASHRELDYRCHRALDAAWAKFHREPCGANMHIAIEACDELRGFCLRSSWSEAFEKSRLELHRRAGRLCSPHGAEVPTVASQIGPSTQAFATAEAKLKYLGKAERKKLRLVHDEQSEVVSMSVAELDRASRRVEDGEVDGPKDLEAAQMVLNANNLGDVSQELQKGGTNLRKSDAAKVVTVDDVEALTEEADGGKVPLLESPHEGSHDADHVIVQGDMRVPRQHSQLIQRRSRISQGYHEGGAKPGRIAAGDPWPGAVVPYCFAREMSKVAKIAFREAVDHYKHHGVCASFHEIPVGNEHNACASKPYLYVQSVQEEGCWSDVGFMASGNMLNIGRGCEVKGIVAHEIGHALGMDHEQARPDRDGYVKVVWSNIKPGFEKEFLVNSEAGTKEPYDYMSLMHYGAYVFSKDKKGKKATLTTLDGKVIPALGQAMGLSSLDVKQLMHMYCPLLVDTAAGGDEAGVTPSHRTEGHAGNDAPSAGTDDHDVVGRGWSSTPSSEQGDGRRQTTALWSVIVYTILAFFLV